jgi:CheY-like chemotaxis protein
MTANAMQGDKEKCMLAGMDDYVSKPLRLEDLLRALNHWGEMKECIYLGTH